MVEVKLEPLSKERMISGWNALLSDDRRVNFAEWRGSFGAEGQMATPVSAPALLNKLDSHTQFILIIYLYIIVLSKSGPD